MKMIDKTHKGPPLSGLVMDRWISGKLIVLGDAIYAMLLYMSQGMKCAIKMSI